MVCLALPLRAADLPAVPPAWEDRVVFRHSFGTAIAVPEQNTGAIVLEQTGGRLVPDGLIGNGFRLPDFSEGTAKSLTLRSPAFSPDKPLTVMLWWRLDQDVAETGGYGILTLNHNAKPGYLTCFIAGKGEWCALKQPTWVYQFYNFPGLGNDNNVWTGRAVTQAGVWHHTALTVANRREIAWYQDGVHRNGFIVRGRDLGKDELSALTIGGYRQLQPMTIDEFLVLDRALSAAEIAEYVRAAGALAEMSRGWGQSGK